MSLIVEDGTGKPDAESYVGVVDASAILAKFGLSQFATLPDDVTREAALRRGTMSLDTHMRANLRGLKSQSGQALVLPRYGMFFRGECLAYNVIPNEAKVANALWAEVAAYRLSGTDTIGDIPANVKKIAYPNETGVEKFQGNLESRSESVAKSLALAETQKLTHPDVTTTFL
jgi:hypothetical protein